VPGCLVLKKILYKFIELIFFLCNMLIAHLKKTDDAQN
jgi:hypothetical protein